MDKRIFGLFLAGLTFATAILTLSGCSDVQQHHVKVLKDYGGNVSFLDGPTWQYTGVTVTGTDYWDGRIWIDLPLDRSSEAKEVYQTADGALLVDMNIAFSRGKSPEERKKWFVNTTDAVGIVKKNVEGIQTEENRRQHGRLGKLPENGRGTAGNSRRKA